ncbi:MAG: hypothetical protein ABJ360_17975 [Roseobacter sp.]
MTDSPILIAQATQAEIADIVASFKEGQSIDGLLLLDAAAKIDDLVEQGAQLTKPLVLGDDLLFVQPDGTIIGLLDGAKAEFALTADNLTIPSENILAVALQPGAWATVEDAVEIDLAVLSATVQTAQQGSGEQTQVLPGDPLNGLPISPLLPPTDFQFPELNDRDVGATEGGFGEPDVIFSGDGVALIEIDSALGVQLSDFIQITAGGAADGEEITNVTVTIANLPIGTTANSGSTAGDGVTETFTFSGSIEAFNALVITLPTDFSTEMRSDFTPGDLTGSITATSNFLGTASFDFPITVEPEGDLEFVGDGARELETDLPVTFILNEAIAPRASDADGSESVTSVTLELTDLPDGAEISVDGGQSFVSVAASYDFSGTLAEYELLQVRVPADFSTTNPAAPIQGLLEAVTDEGAIDARDFELVVEATPDIVITPPETITVDEDGDGTDGAGVTVDLNLNIFVEDTDGSEDDTTVEIVFTDLPAGTTFPAGIGSGDATTGVWVGTLAEANALTLLLPGDYSGTITSVITATNVEGSATATQDIIVSPAADVDVEAPDLIAAESDAPLVINPSATWVLSISDGDDGQPPETLEAVTLTLNDLPPGVLIENVPATTISYDVSTGGTFSFTGTPAEYELLRLVFPEDYSTQNEGLPGDALTGEISGTSTEGDGTPEPVRLEITAEGDAELDVLPFDPLIEAETGQTVRLGQILQPQVTDADGSESIAEIVVTITGLPSINFDLTDTSGFPAGAAALTTATDGSQTLTVVFDTANVADVAAAFDAASFTLPADFSTANRSDLSGGATTLPISVTASLTTDEDSDLTMDTAVDGQATAQAFVTVEALEDIDLTVPLTIEAQEDGGVENNADGVRVPLQISVIISDDDGSETATVGTPFSAEVSIEFTDLPPGAGVSTGTLIGSTWTGSVAEANALAIDFPGNYAGVVLANVLVKTPVETSEGVESSPTTIVVTPTPDINITGTVVGAETDAPLSLVLSDFIDLTIDPDNEELFSLNLVLPGLPVGTVALDANGLPVGTLTADGSGTFVFEFSYDSTDVPVVDLTGIELVFPADFSTENPDIPLAAELEVVSVTPGFPPSDPVMALIDVVISPEADVQLNVLTAPELRETDAPVDLRPSDYLEPEATDSDGSESIQLVSVTFNDLPAGTEFSIDGVTFDPAPFDLGFVGTLDEYNALIVRLPADYSTQSPAETLTGTVIASTDEFGVATGTFDVSVAAEGDLTIVGSGTLTLSENDAPGVVDLDDTTQSVLVFQLANAATAIASDNDGSETIIAITVALADLPEGAQISLDGGNSYGITVTAGSQSLTFDSVQAFEDVYVQLPADFSTQRAEGPITGTLTFQTDESVLNGETLNAANGGFLSQDISIEVTAEGDVLITGADLVVAEDTATPIDLGLGAAITDIDGSETLSMVTVTFEGLSTAGDTVLSDGTVLSGAAGANVWTGSSLADLNALAVTSFPEHFSGVVTLITNVVTNETGPAGQSATFVLDVTPVAEPEITLTVDASETAVTEINADQFSVKEDNSFLLQIDASTPDQDGSETLQNVVIENVPAGWVGSDGAVDLTLFETGSADIASAEISGTTLNITFNAGVTEFDGALRVTPLADSDQDVDTLVGSDLQATVTSVDTATGLADNVATAQDSVDVDVDAVVDDIDLATGNRTSNENVNGRRFIDAGITRLSLDDDDGSETYESVTLTISVDTLSDDFDAADTANLDLNFRGLDAFVSVRQQDAVTGDNVVQYRLTQPDGVSTADFESAITSLRVVFAENFSGQTTIDGEVSWRETETGDAEADLTDNTNSETFQTVLTVRPISEAILNAGVFVRNTDFVAADSSDSVTEQVVATTADTSVVDADTLTLVESTADSSGFGQVEAFLQLGASTPDTDGSEDLTTLVVSNIPSSWIGVDETTNDVVLDRSMFFSLDGSMQIDQAEFDKLASAEFDAATGELTLTFVPDVTEFNGSVVVFPALYEDYDVDRAEGDPFTDDGTFFGADLNFALTTTDGNTVTSATRNADLTVDVDVDPINNDASVESFPVGNEAEVDAAGGVLQFGFVPSIEDLDGSETIVAAVLRDVPDFLTVFVTDPSNPTGPKIPALLTNINGDGTLDWSLDESQWLGVEFRGVPLHFSGDLPIQVDIVTQEANGTNNVTELTTVTISVDPVVDGGDPSETFRTFEDVAVQVQLDGNLIDTTPESPEEILDAYTIFDVQPDSEGRLPLFFDGVPVQTGTTANGDPIYSNLLSPNATGGYDIDEALAGNLFVLPGQDSNENVVFDVEVTYQEVESTQEQKDDGSALRTDTGTVTILVEGVADTPTVDGQDADPDATVGGIDKTTIDDFFAPNDVAADGVANADRAYAYAGFANAAFQLDQRVSDIALQNGLDGISDPFTAADPLSGERQEITFADGDPDGSETIYYVITEIPAGVRFLGGSPIDTSGGSYLVTESQLENLSIVAEGVADPTYHDLNLNVFVTENDVDFSGIPQVGPGVSIDDVLQAIDDLTGGSLTTTEFSILILPDDGSGGGETCPPDDPRMLPIPELSLVGEAFEDTPNELHIAITENSPFWSGIADLTTLPNGVSGDFGFGLTLPAGATLTSSTPGAVIFDPITGQYAIDFALLGVDPDNPLQTEGTVTYTPPPNESSPTNPFTSDETFGEDDPFDSLPDIQTQSVLNNFTCNDFATHPGSLPLVVQPVVDGPQITIDVPASSPEDTGFATDILISSEDGGERLSGDVVLEINGDPGATLFRGGVEIAPDTGTGGSTGVAPRYTLDPADIVGLEVRATEHFSGEIDLTVTATTEDIDGSTLSGTTTQSITIEPVADEAEFVYSTDTTPTETGLPLVTDPTGATPIVTIAEDTVGVFGDFLPVAQSPDQDGSEASSAVIGPLPDYVVLGGASGIIDNGDGTFTVPVSSLANLTIGLVDEHARTPDSEDPTILDEIPVAVSINTLELDNSDQATGTTEFVLRVLPIADEPTVQATIAPTGGAEDDGTQYEITLSGTTPDVHETIDFQITVPTNSTVFLDGLALSVAADGTVDIPGVVDPIFTGTGAGFVADGVVTFVSAPDFAGEVEIDAVAISTDSNATYAYTDTETSDVVSLGLEITPTGDLEATVVSEDVVVPETDAAVTFEPSSNVMLAVTDPSESVDNVTFELVGIPEGTTYNVGGAEIPVSGTLSFSGTEAEYNALQVTLPADFSTNGVPLQALVTATTDEGGFISENFTLDVTGELDATLSVAGGDLAQSETTDLLVALGIDAQVTDSQVSPSETGEQILVTFDDPLPVGTTASDGVLSADRRTLTFDRGALSPADFGLAIAALSLTVPASFAGDITGNVNFTTNHGTTSDESLAINVNARPVVSGPLEVTDVFDTSLTLTFAELAGNATDTTALTIENIMSNDPLVQIDVVNEDVTITVPAGFSGTPVLEYDIVDSGTVPARSATTATVEFDTLQMQDSGTTVVGPDGVTRSLLTDVTGDPALGTIAKGTDSDDAVIWDAAERPYDGITEFQLLGGSDMIDLTGATNGFTVDGGAGNDLLTGSDNDDVLLGGADNDVLEGAGGFDQLFGGAGDDIFVLGSGPITIADSIGDFDTGDQIDLSEQVNGVDDVSGVVTYDSATGALLVGGETAFNVQASGGGIPAQVEVIFEDSAGAAQTAVV